MSVNSQFQSNSEMQQAMRDLDSYEHSPTSVDSSRVARSNFNESTVGVEQSQISDSLRSGRQVATSNLLTPGHAEDTHSDTVQSRHLVTDEHDREHEWNKRHPKSNATSTGTKHRHSLHSSSGIGSEYRPLSRNGASTYIDDDEALVTSQNNHQQSSKSKEKGKDIEAVHALNKGRSTARPLSMPNPSLLSPLEPARATSSSSRPDSRLSASSTQSSFRGHHSRSSSRASSSAGSLFSSNPDIDTEKVEIDHERERNWNAPRPLWHQHPSSPNHRPSSSSSVGQHSLSTERVRTLSFPSRPDSRLSISSPRPGHQRQDSYDSLRSSSRASSRASSPRGSLRGSSSIDGDEELLHEQERNWNSPRPHHFRSSSSALNHPSPSNTLKRTQSLTKKIPFSPSSSTSSSHFSMDTSASARRRAESLKSTRAPSVHSSSPVLLKESSKHRTSLSPFSSVSTKLSAPSSSSRPYDYPSRPHSPLPLINSNASLDQLNVGHTSVLPSPSFNSKSQSTPSPNSLKSLSRTVPLPSPSVLQRNSGVRSSQIPVRTSPETKTTGTVLFPESRTEFPVIQELQELPQQIPDTHSELVEDGNNDKANSDSTDTDTEAEESNQLVQENTPTLRPNGALPSIEAPDPVEASSAYVSFETGASLQKIIASPPSPPLSSPSDGPSTPEAEVSFSFPSTPPRRDSRNPTKLEFQTPSPPKNLPDLPDPPSDSSDHEDHEYPAPIKGNLSSLKTPKPPGAWTATPLPPRTHALLRSNSLPTDDENDSGLATPAASLSRAATMPPRTPALPGGWMNTPANRKSVRFHEETAAGSLKAETVAPKVEEAVHAVVKSLGSSPNSKVGTTGDDNRQTSPSLAHSPRKATTIRVVDAFGREEKKGISDSIRIVDAMGQIVVEDSMESGSSIVPGIPPTRQKALEHVRNGLHELVEEMNDEEGLVHVTTSEISRERIRKLEQESREARESRAHLASKLFSNVENIQKKLAPLRASMQQTTPVATPPFDRRPTGWSWLLWALLQLLIVFAMYRVASSYAKKIFFTTYYDPLYPDLFFYTSSPTNYCTSPSVFETLQSEGLRAAARQVFEYMAIIFSSWQPPCQWQGSYQGSTAIWPPT
ncbi:uncharacterized protein C8R40DRAFT_1105004 [Lentinula edodes]|uniref:uncharacterized protein n=1 Tax=Lentinula edodes TaxID=5353 RepID=UPI001E8DBC66|nr:uncharacterized protein C8R40DRAFT_1105004 [Lentinula edodes]KAH7875128.1 hypothetical protein C8R40DRAFT_1105004 [Lentinula edodes]